MNRRLLGWVAAIAAVFVAIGLLGVDRPLAEWVHRSGIEQARVFAWGLATLDFVAGISLWFWLAGCCALAIGAVGFALQREARWPRAFLAAGVVQIATLATMILGKDHFGRLRPQQVFESGDWSKVWFVGGGSFPSGHSAFYFGLLLPLAAAAPRAWQRIALMLIPVFAICARIDMGKHFLSDVAASALIAAGTALLFATILKRWSAGPLAPERRSPP